MRLTILGSGTCELREDRSSPAYLLEAGPQKIMLDTGQGALRRLMQCGLMPNDIDMICQSHHHLDHMGDLLPFLFALNFDPLMSQSARLTLLASKRFKQILDGLSTVYGHWIEPASELLTKKLLTPGQEYQAGEVRIATAKAQHIPTSIAFRFEYLGGSVVYLGDTAICDGVLELSRGADLLITHCAANDDKTKPGHLNPSAAASLARDAGVGRVVAQSSLPRSESGKGP